MSKDMKCQYCGAEKMDEVIPAHLRLEHRWRCETPFSVRYDGTIQATTFRSDLCREREARRKAESELEEARRAGLQLAELTVKELRAENQKLCDLLVRALAVEPLTLSGSFELRAIRAEYEARRSGGRS